MSNKDSSVTIKTSIFILCLIINLKMLECELHTYSAVTAIEKLLLTQAHLIKAITKAQKIVDAKERRIVQTYLGKLKKEHALSQKVPNSEEYLGNPINCYTSITRLYRDLQFVEKILNKTGTYKRNTSLVYPTSLDAKGAAEGIIMLQLMYRLQIPDLANGTLISHYSNTMEQYYEHVSPMTTNDCLDFAKLYFHEENRSGYVAWLVEAYKKYETDHLFCPMSKEEILAQIGAQHLIMENWSNSIYWLEKWLNLSPRNIEVANTLKYARYRQQTDEGRPKKRTSYQPFGMDTNSKVMRLCRHEFQNIARNESFTCYYVHGPHPFLLLAPIKAQTLHRSPDVTMFYDVISDSEILNFKADTKPLLSRSSIVNGDNGTVSISVSRTSHDGRLLRKTAKVISVERRMEHFTGLQIGSVSEDIQVANYGIGGGYSPHCDAFDDEPTVKTALTMMLTKKQRIATVLFYMSDVEQGGATVFTEANLTVFPVKNAALFWYNLDPWGFGDDGTEHAACPVLRGSKWVATKWFQLIEQDLTRVCPPRA